MQSLIAATIACFSFWLAAASIGFGTERPNIVLILADDLGYGDLGCYNPASKINTPSLDSLAEQGVRFTDAHAGGTYCVPSRYALLTGRFSPRAASLKANQGPVIENGRQTIASMLRENGYQTAMVGKWHLGFEVLHGEKGSPMFDYAKPLRGGPLDRGFDSFFGIHASLDIPPYFYIRDRSAVLDPTELVAASTSLAGDDNWNHIQGAFWREGSVAADFKHEEVTPRFVAEATRTIDEHAAKKKQQPLFLYLALPSPHTPWLPTPEFQGKSSVGMYGDFVMQVDDAVGKIMSSLASNGMTENTLVIFSSDNGPVWYEKDVERFAHDSAGGLRGKKATAWEGGHRMPFITRWPAKIPAKHVSAQTICFSDIFATLTELLKVESTPPSVAEDSVSFLPTLLAPLAELFPRPPIVHDSRTLRSGDWKLILHKGRGRGILAVNYDDAGELYNLREDPAETNNQINDQPEQARSLRKKLQEIMGN